MTGRPMVSTARADARSAPAARALEQTRARYPDATGFVERDGVRVAWERYGAGDPAILLMPTWSIIHSRHWKFQIPVLARHHTVVTFDGRGNGRSDRPVDAAAYADVEFVEDGIAVLDAAGVQRAAVAGLSMGAGYALRLAGDHHDRVLGLILIGPSVDLDVTAQHEDDPFWLPPASDEGWATYNAEYWRRDWPGFVAFFMRQVVHEPHSTKALEDLEGWALETDPETMITVERAPYLRDPTSRALIERIRCPSLVISGTDDHVDRHERARRLAALLGARLLALGGSGHAPNVREPVRVNLAIRAFLATLAGGPR
jgi:pimeloyl-ACP methyl ester carboxylesterase